MEMMSGKIKMVKTIKKDSETALDDEIMFIIEEEMVGLEVEIIPNAWGTTFSTPWGNDTANYFSATLIGREPTPIEEERTVEGYSPEAFDRELKAARIEMQNKGLDVEIQFSSWGARFDTVTASSGENTYFHALLLGRKKGGK
jgi:hypothetical protein